MCGRQGGYDRYQGKSRRVAGLTANRSRCLSLPDPRLHDWDPKKPVGVTWTPPPICGDFEIIARAMDVCGGTVLSSPVPVRLENCH